MPHPESGEPQDRAVPTGASSRRKVQPLAPEPGQTSATAPQLPGGPTAMPRGQRIIIGVGLAYCAFVWLSMALALLHRG